MLNKFTYEIFVQDFWHKIEQDEQHGGLIWQGNTSVFRRRVSRCLAVDIIILDSTDNGPNNFLYSKSLIMGNNNRLYCQPRILRKVHLDKYQVFSLLRHWSQLEGIHFVLSIWRFHWRSVKNLVHPFEFSINISTVFYFISDVRHHDLFSDWSWDQSIHKQ